MQRHDNWQFEISEFSQSQAEAWQGFDVGAK